MKISRVEHLRICKAKILIQDLFTDELHTLEKVIEIVVGRNCVALPDVDGLFQQIMAQLNFLGHENIFFGLLRAKEYAKEQNFSNNCSYLSATNVAAFVLSVLFFTVNIHFCGL